MALLMGKLPAVRPHSLDDLTAYTQAKLPAPPPSFLPDTVTGLTDWGMMGNDQYGDCGFAGVGHLILANNLEVGEHDAVPSDQQVIQQYLSFTGGQDTGIVLADGLKAWHHSGFFGGNKIAAYVPVAPHRLTMIHQAIAFYGGAYVGIQCPDSAQEQFARNVPWTVVKGAQIDGGHCIAFFGYDQQYLYAVSWGQLVKVSYPFWARYGDEAWAVISQEFTEAGHDALKLDLASLQADLKRV